MALAAAPVRQTAVRSSDRVLLRVARTGNRVTAQADGTIHARWDHAGLWQRFVIEKDAGSGDIQPGDAIFLTAWTGKLVTVGDYPSGDLERTAVHAKWGHKGTWQKLIIKTNGETGPIMAGDEIFLQAWTGAWVDADAPGSAGAVQARWDDQGEWQKLIIEAAEPATTMAPAPTTLAPTTTSPELGDEVSADVVSSRAWEHFQLLNQLRAEGFTCPGGTVFDPNPVALKFHCRLWRAARLHSEDMAKQSYFSHTSKDGRSPWQRADEQGLDAHGENIAAGSSTAAFTLELFKKSDGHCSNMLKKDFKVAGVGYAAGGSFGHYWTQMFSLIDSDLSSLDTTCYPSDVALIQKDTGDVAEAHQKVLAEAWSRSPA